MQQQNDHGSRYSSGVKLEVPRSWVCSLRKVSPMRFSMRSRGGTHVQQNLLDFRAYRSRMQVTSSNSFGSRVSYCGARRSQSPAEWSMCMYGFDSDFWASGSPDSLNENIKRGIRKTWKSSKDSSRTSPLRTARCCVAWCTTRSFDFSWGSQPVWSGRMLPLSEPTLRRI